MSTAGTASSAATQPVRSIALSLTEDYCPSWGAWEGVRELVQNFHDGCLDSGTAVGMARSSGRWQAAAAWESSRTMQTHSG